MAGKGLRLLWSPTSVGGVIAQSMTAWPQVINGSVKLNHIYIKSARPSTTFDFKITSPSGNDILVRPNNVGEISEAKELVMSGLYTLTIYNVTNGAVMLDDTFSGEFMFQELKNK